jgi:hypothetical protein
MYTVEPVVPAEEMFLPERLTVYQAYWQDDDVDDECSFTNVLLTDTAVL